MQWQELGSRLIGVGATGLGTIIGGPMGGAIGGVLGEQVGRALGVPATPEAIAAVLDERPESAGPALRAFEAEHREEIASLERASLSYQLELAKLDRGDGFFSWGWRPALMWLIGYLWLQNAVGTPVILNGVLGYAIPVVPYPDLLFLTGIMSGFYMGGHTVKEAVKTWKGGVK
jgi:hypothetical protein